MERTCPTTTSSARATMTSTTSRARNGARSRLEHRPDSCDPFTHTAFPHPPSPHSCTVRTARSLAMDLIGSRTPHTHPHRTLYRHHHARKLPRPPSPSRASSPWPSPSLPARARHLRPAHVPRPLPLCTARATASHGRAPRGPRCRARAAGFATARPLYRLPLSRPLLSFAGPTQRTAPHRSIFTPRHPASRPAPPRPLSSPPPPRDCKSLLRIV